MFKKINQLIGYNKNLNIKDKMAYYIAISMLLALIIYSLFFSYVLKDHNIMLPLSLIPFILYIISFLSFKKRHFMIGKTILLFTAMFITLSGTFVLFSSSSLIGLYLLCLPPGAYTLYYVERKSERILAEIVAATSFIAIVMTVFFSSEEIVKIPKESLPVYQGINILIVAFLVTFIQYIYSLDMNRFQHRISILATRDSLTDIYNRRVFFETGNRMFKECNLLPFGLILIDVDHFKKTNDEYGHLAGDKLLKILAATISQAIGEDENIYRYGGEEFIVLSPCKTPEDLALLAEKLRLLVEHIRFETSSKEIIPMTISLGGAYTEQGYEGLDQMIKAADDALYQAKINGRNCYILASNNHHL